MRSAMSIAVMNGHVEAGSILARNGASCTETEKVELGNTYTDFLLSLQLVQPSIHKAPIQPKAPPKAVPIRPKSLQKAAPIQPQPGLSQLLQPIPIQRQPINILPPKAVPIQPQPIQPKPVPKKAQPWIQPGWFGRNEQREEEVKG